MNPYFTHAFCLTCKAVKEVHHHDLVYCDTDYSFLGGDITCKNCDYVISTVYVKRAESMQCTDCGKMQPLNCFETPDKCAECVKDGGSTQFGVGA